MHGDSPLPTQCTRSKPPIQLEFPRVGRRRLVASFDGGTITSNAGALLLRAVEKCTGVCRRAAECFQDYRDPSVIEHTVEDLVTQRVMAVALGYEDLNDHDTLRRDPLVAAAVGKADPTGENRVRVADRGAALAGKSTLNRLELVGSKDAEADRYKKVTYDEAALDALLVDVFIESHPTPPARIVLDVDATDDPLHGQQEGRFFHGYYRHYCYLPLYIFCGAQVLCARLRPSNIDGAAGVVDEVARIVGQVRQAWPSVSILVRGDSGFCRDELLHWCEEHAVDYVIGLAKNARLKEHIAPELAQAQAQCQETGTAARVFADFRYRTRESWSRERRVVGKAEHLPAGANPRFVVTSLRPDTLAAQALYEDFYCARGDMENRIKEQQLALFADRTSSARLRANQLRLYWATLAYVLLQHLRDRGLAGTRLARAQCDTLRLRLLKIGAHVRVTVRRICVALSELAPDAALFILAAQRLRAPPGPA